MSVGWEAWAAAEGDAIRSAGRWRAPRSFDASGPAGIYDGRRVVSFASNDYLGLAMHPSVRAAAHDAIERWGTGAGAARLIVGSRPVHGELEEALADANREEAAAVFPTGFAANLGVVTTFGVEHVLSDELNHASIVDGCRLARGEVLVYRHADAPHCASLLASAGGRAVVVSDLVFSMDGDVAPVEGLAEACRQHGALLILDEAHAVLGPDVAPACDHVRVGTLSKTLGAQGGFVAGPRSLVDLVVNRARPYIFTTGLAPPAAAAALAALAIVRGAEGDALRARLRGNIDHVAPGHPSPIVPLVIGDETDAVALSAALLDRGVLVPAIRPPTVPIGTSRLRVALSAAHTESDMALLVGALDECRSGWR